MRYRHAHRYVWAASGYNHSTSGMLTIAIDYMYIEWNNKALG
jgi:NAD(P)H-dependent FMN reductase